MNANELMIGDWVKLKDTNSYFKPECIFYNAIRIETTGHHLEDVEIDKFESIQLTKKILKKNGWIIPFMNDNIYGYKINNKYDDIIFYTFSNKHVKIYIDCDNFIDTHCEYVHELQHSLRLCGLNDLADNFKL